MARIFTGSGMPSTRRSHHQTAKAHGGTNAHGARLCVIGSKFEFSEKEWNGGAKGNRTPDLYNAIVALSQLSYGPIFHM